MSLSRLATLLAALLLLFGAGAPRPERQREREMEAELEPSDWFGAQRAFPGTTVNQEAYQAALSWARVERSAAIFRAQSATPMVWQQAGPLNIGGRVTALAVTPGGSTLYLGAAAGGVFKSVNGGVNWTPVFDQSASIGALALDPSNVNTLYVGTGESNAAIDNYDGSGLFRSQNGAGWEYLGLQEVRRIARVRVDPSNSNRIFVAAMGSQFSTGPDRGLYRSENGGASWTKVLFVSDSTGVCDLAIDPSNSAIVYCASWERLRRATYRRAYGPECAIWKSVDHGSSWIKLTNGLPAPADSVGRIGLAIAPSQPSRIYAQILGGPAQGLNGLGVYRSDDGGASWIRRDVAGFTGAFGGFGWYFGDMAVDPSNPDRVYCLGVSLMTSADGGANFSTISSAIHTDFHALWIDPANPSRLYVGQDGGFYSTTTMGGSWTKSLDLPITQFYAGAVDPSNPARILGGAQDNSTPIAGATPSSWTQFYGQGDGFYCLIDPTNASVGFAETQNGSGGTGPQRTQNGGSSWSAPTTSFGEGARWNWCTPFAMDPSNHNVLLTGGYRIFKSTDNGKNYSVMSGDLTRNIIPTDLSYASTLSTIEIAPSNSSVYYVGTTDGRLWRSQNAGANWTEITGTLPIRWVTRVSADPTNAAIVYVTLSGFSLDEYVAHVYRSVDSGNTWTPIDGNLPDIPANDILVDPNDTNRLYLANDVGVYTSRDLGGTWYPLGTGMPPVPVADLTLHNASRTLIAATHGRSQWTIDLHDLPVAVGPSSMPARLALSAPAPNPSRGDVRCEVELTSAGRVRAEVFDAMGRRVSRLLDHPLAAGQHPIAWSGRTDEGGAAPAGTYYLRVSLDDRAIASRRLTRLR